MTILITAGEPAGIGPDIIIQLVQQALACCPLVIADPQLLRERAALLDLTVEIIECDDPTQLPAEHQAKQLHVWPQKLITACHAGKLATTNSEYVLACLQTAAEYCLNNPTAAIITAPVHKAVINQAGYKFSGHTEFLAEMAGIDKVVMLLASQKMRVALYSTHIPLAEVSASLNQAELIQTIEILQHSMQQGFAIKQPRILVCGLNPHAGEDGSLGREEIDIMQPALAECAARGINVAGPLPADTAFIQQNLTTADVVLAMYHDQGLPVIKHADFENAVNITLGLPFVRTSVDHGTALPLAGTGQAKPQSLQQAFSLAWQLTDNSGN